jgi:hypothetical protein
MRGAIRRNSSPHPSRTPHRCYGGDGCGRPGEARLFGGRGLTMDEREAREWLLKRRGGLRLTGLNRGDRLHGLCRHFRTSAALLR